MIVNITLCLIDLIFIAGSKGKWVKETSTKKTAIKNNCHDSKKAKNTHLS